MTTHPHTIAIDLDSTLNNMLECVLRLYNQEYSDYRMVEDFVGWDMHSYVKPECGVKIYKYLTAELFRNCRPQPNSQAVVRALQQRGYDIVIASSSSGHTVDAKHKWVDEHFPTISHKNFIAISRKSLLDVAYLIDDGPHNFPPDAPYYGLLFNQPWNRNMPDASCPYTRTHGWLEVASFFNIEIADAQPTQAALHMY